MSNPPSLLDRARAELHAIGISLTTHPGTYCVNYRDARSDATAYFTDELQDAIERGRAMAADTPPPADPPLGPTGRRRTRRGMMLKHNAKIAARRSRKNRG